MTIAVLHRVTTRYIPEEDRLLISGEAAQGSVVSMWLTCRLARRLVVHLADSLSSAREESPAYGLAQEMSQESAMARLKPQVPVTSDGDVATSVLSTDDKRSDTPLIRSVEVKRSARSVVVMFCERDKQTAVAELHLTATPLRQWLGILQRQFRAAAWPTTDWPVWLTEATERTVLPGQIH